LLTVDYDKDKSIISFTLIIKIRKKPSTPERFLYPINKRVLSCL